MADDRIPANAHRSDQDAEVTFNRAWSAIEVGCRHGVPGRGEHGVPGMGEHGESG